MACLEKMKFPKWEGALECVWIQWMFHSTKITGCVKSFQIWNDFGNSSFNKIRIWVNGCWWTMQFCVLHKKVFSWLSGINFLLQWLIGLFPRNHQWFIERNNHLCDTTDLLWMGRFLLPEFLSSLGKLPLLDLQMIPLLLPLKFC